MTQELNIRKTDSPFHDPVQSSRFVIVEEKWFFLTREKNMQGPYANRPSAQTALDIYLDELCISESANDNNKPTELPTYSAEELENNVAFAQHLFEDRWKK